MHGFFVHSTRAGKFAVWADLLDRLELKGDERLLDIGCGRGAVLLMAAHACPAGGPSASTSGAPKINRATPSKSPARTRNLRAWPIGSSFTPPTCVELPFDDGSFDVVVSSLAIHNVPGAGERARALCEAARVLKNGGKLAIARHPPHARVRQGARGLRAEDHRSTLDRSVGRSLGGDPPGRRDQALESVNYAPVARTRFAPLRVVRPHPCAPGAELHGLRGVNRSPERAAVFDLRGC